DWAIRAEDDGHSVARHLDGARSGSFGGNVGTACERHCRTVETQSAAIAARRDAVLAVEEVLRAGEEVPLRTAMGANLDERLAPADRQTWRLGALPPRARCAVEHFASSERVNGFAGQRQGKAAFGGEVCAHAATHLTAGQAVTALDWADIGSERQSQVLQRFQLRP